MSWTPGPQEWAALREDVGYIRAKVEVLPDHELRLRALERFRRSIPSAAVLGLVLAVAALVIH